jgi:hypothetical protein
MFKYAQLLLAEQMAFTSQSQLLPQLQPDLNCPFLDIVQE